MSAKRVVVSCLLVAAVWVLAGCGDTLTINQPNAPPDVDLTGVPAAELLATVGDPYVLDLAPYVDDEWDGDADLTFTVLSVSNMDAPGSFTGSTYQNTFSLVGTVTVTFAVADSTGSVSIASFDVSVTRGSTPPPVNFPPDASLAVQPKYPLVGRSTSLDATASTDPNDDPLFVNWNFGDGAMMGPTSELQVDHVYSDELNITASAAVTDGELTDSVVRYFNTWKGLAVQPNSWRGVETWPTKANQAALAIDAAGAHHIAYYDDASGTLYYLSSASGAWVETPVPDAALKAYGKHASIAATGTYGGNTLEVHFAYRDEDNKALRYALYDNPMGGGTWAFEWPEAPAAGSDFGTHTAIAVGGGTVRIAYASQSPDQLRYVTGSLGAWNAPETAWNNITPKNVSLALNVLNNPFISCVAGGTLRVAWKVIVWDRHMVDFASDETSIAVDAANLPHVSYYNPFTGLKHARYDAEWILTELASDLGEGRYSSIAVDPTAPPGDACITYYDETEGELRAAVISSGGGWYANTLDRGEEMSGESNVGAHCALRWNVAASRFDVVYQNVSSGACLLRSFDLSSVNDESGSFAAGSSVGYLDMAIDSAGAAHACWYDAATGKLRYAYNAGPEPYDPEVWTVEDVDGPDIPNDIYWTGLWCSIAVEGTTPHIAYMAMEITDPGPPMVYTGHLKHASKTGTWTTEFVSTVTPLFLIAFPDIAVDGADIHIAYVDVTVDLFNEGGDNFAGDLYHVAYSTGAWGTPAAVDPSTDSPFLATVCIDPADYVHIVYADVDFAMGGGSGRYATNRPGPGFASEEVAVFGKMEGGPTSLGIVASATTVYVSMPTPNIRQGCAMKPIGGGAWTIEDISPVGAGGFSSRVMLDGADEPVVCYYDGEVGEVSVAQRTPDGDWIAGAFAQFHGEPGASIGAAMNPLTGSVHAVRTASVGERKYAGIMHAYVRELALRTRAAFYLFGTDMKWADASTDGSDAVHVIYANGGAETLDYLTNASGAWTTEVLASDVQLSDPPRMVIDAAGALHVAYTTGWPGDGGLYYATNASGAWQVEPVTTAPRAYGPSIALQGATVHIGFATDDPGGVGYVSGSAGAWGAYTEVDAVSGTEAAADYDIEVYNQNNVFEASSTLTDEYESLIVTNTTGADGYWRVDILEAADADDLGFTVYMQSPSDADVDVDLRAQSYTVYVRNGEDLIVQLQSFQEKSYEAWHQAMVAAGGILQFVYHDGRFLWYATSPGGPPEAVATGPGMTGLYPTLVVDGGGDVHAGYFMSSYADWLYPDGVFAVSTSLGSWGAPERLNDWAVRTRAVLDPSGVPLIFYDSGAVCYNVKGVTARDEILVDPTGALDVVAPVFDGGGRMHVVHATGNSVWYVVGPLGLLP